MKLGWIGLGIMGRPMVQHLLAAGHTVHACSRSGVPAELAAQGVVACASPADVAREAQVIFLMLPDTPDVAKVLFDDGGVAAQLGAGQTVVDMSSISPVATREFAARVAERGASFLDAPVSGGEVGAKAASLTIMCGGDEAVFAACEPLLRLMGKNVTLVGGCGAGQTAKVANQMIVALNIQAVAEALSFAQDAGVDPARVRQALLGGFASSRVLEVHGQRMLDGAFAPGFRIALHQKDLRLALESAGSVGAALPATRLAQDLFDGCSANGEAQLDHSAMFREMRRRSSKPAGGSTAN